MTPKEVGEYYLKTAKEGKYAQYCDLEHAYVDDGGRGHCLKCIYFNVECKWGIQIVEGNKVLALGGSITSKNCFYVHFLREIHNPTIRMYKVKYIC